VEGVAERAERHQLLHTHLREEEEENVNRNTFLEQECGDEEILLWFFSPRKKPYVDL